MLKKKYLYVIPVILVIAIIALYRWEPWQGSRQRQSVDLNNAGEIVKACRQASGELKSYSYKTELSAGSQISVSVNSRTVRDQTRRQMVDFSWKIPKMSGAATMYNEGEKIYIFHPLQDKWILPNEDRTISPFMDFFRKQLNLIDPVDNVLRLDPLGKNISTYLQGADEGADSVAIQVIPDAKALSEINKSLPPQLAPGELKDIKQYFWVSKKDFLVTRYEVRASVAFFGIKTMNFVAVSTPLDYNSTGITIPKPLQEKMKQK